MTVYAPPPYPLIPLFKAYDLKNVLYKKSNFHESPRFIYKTLLNKINWLNERKNGFQVKSELSQVFQTS